MVGNLRELIPAFFVGPNGEQLSADEIARRREVAGSLLAQATDTSPTAGGGASVLAKAIQGLSYGINEGRARRASQANAEASQANIAAMLGGAGGASTASAFPPAPSANVAAALTGGSPDVASARVAQAHGDSAATGGEPTADVMTSYIREAAARRGVDPDIAVRVARSEGLAPGVWQSNVINKRGQRETSYGPFQLLVGGGLGDKFQKLYGASPADKSTWRQQIDFALDEAATGGWSPWYGAAKVGVGRRTGLDGARALGYQPSAVGASPAVAANEALAAGQLQGGLTPAALNSWAEQNYAPGAIDRSVLAPVSAPASEVLVAESPEDIAAAELAMNDPAFAGPAVVDAAPAAAPAVSPAPAPVVAPQVAQALTALPVNESLPMAGGVDNPRPIVPTAPQNTMQGLNPAVVQALSNPNATAQERSVAQALLQQHVAQNQALQAQAQEQAERANMLAQRRGLAGRMGVDPNYAVDDTIWKAASDKAFRDAPSRAAGSYIERPDGTLEQVPLNPTGDIQEYEYARANGYQGSFTDFQRDNRRAGATSITNTVGGNSSKFTEKSDELAATRLSDYVGEGARATQTMSDMQQLIDLTNVIGTGREAELKAALGPYAEALGIDIANLGEIQAFKSITDRLAPQMRPAGAGSSSDVDVKMFLNSLPNLRNRADGNIIIANTMRGIAENKMQAAEISSRALSGEMSWQEAEKQIRALPNPYENFKNFMKDGSSSTSSGVKWRVK